MKKGRSPNLHPASGLVEHYFRREYGGLVALLVRRVGLGRLELVEDAVQAAMLAAMTAWREEVPREPRAWLYRVAHNHLVGVLRKEGGQRRILEELQEEEVAPNEAFFAGEIADERLRMLFVCCDDELPAESRLVLALKTLCGFSVEEIAFRLFTSEANVYKRLARARERLRDSEPETPPLERLRFRLPSVHSVIYLLFNEGYLSIDPEQAIRVELCEEALRLGEMLAAHPVGAGPTTFALLALMHLHAARLAARQDATGGLLLLEEQTRRLHPEHFERGASYLAMAADGDELTRYHVEAGIAAEHCFAPSFAETRWGAIAELYVMLERFAPSPITTLNRAVAVAQAEGPAAGLATLEGVVPPAWLEGHYLWDAVLADLHGRAGHLELAARHREAALLAAPSPTLRRLLARRLTGAPE